jgi:DNA repair protein RecN (Recombination protein N)
MLAKVLLLDCQQSIEQEFKQSSYQQSLLDQLIDQNMLQGFNMNLKTLQDLEDTYHRIENHTLHQDDIDLMRYQVQELEQALEGIASIEDLVENVSVGKRSQQVANELKHLDESLRLCHKKLSCIADDIEDVTGPILISKKLSLEESIDMMRQELSDLFEQQEIAQQNMLHAKDQLDQLRELGRKHRRPVEQLSTVYEMLCQKLEDIESAEEKLPQLSMQIKKQQSVLQSSAELLYQARLEVSQMIEKTFNESVAFLGMADASCMINVHQAELKLNGGQMTEIMFQNNQKKEATHDFNQLSGGELSRVSLLFQILCSKQSILLLDEVDTGLSGDAAKLVRKFLQKIAKKSQVVAISHLAAVAAGASTHFLVKKHRESSVYSTIEKLSADSIVSEISRMLGGKQTKISIAHAHECLSDAEIA